MTALPFTVAVVGENVQAPPLGRPAHLNETLAYRYLKIVLGESPDLLTSADVNGDATVIGAAPTMDMAILAKTSCGFLRSLVK